MPPEYWDKAREHLSRRDKKLGRVISAYEGEFLAAKGDAFGTLARAVVGQQISVKAADTVWRRFEEMLVKVNPESVGKAAEEALRGVGLSRQKVVYLRSLAEYFAGAGPDFRSLGDEEAIRELCAIKGIGRWTAEMFLIFHLERPDVLPIADIGLLKACERLYGISEKNAVIERAEKWRPYRSVATWYLWRSLDPVPVEY